MHQLEISGTQLSYQVDFLDKFFQNYRELFYFNIFHNDIVSLVVFTPLLVTRLCTTKSDMFTTSFTVVCHCTIKLIIFLFYKTLLEHNNISSILKNNFEKMPIGTHSSNEGHLEKPQIILMV